MQSHAHSGSGQDIITSGQSYTQFMGWQTFHTVTSQKWRDARRLKNLLPDSVEGTFPACLFFSVEIFFFFWWVLMLWPYAWGCPEDNGAQCADRPCLRPPPPFSHSLSPLQGHKPASVRAITLTTSAWAQHLPPPPPYLPETPSAHIHLTLSHSVPAKIS